MEHPLTTYRKANKLSMREVAEFVKVSPSIICRWENGERTPRLAHIRKIEELTQNAITADDWEPQPESIS